MKLLSLSGIVLAILVTLIGYRALADDKPTSAPSTDAGIKVLADFETDADAKLVKGGDDYVKVEIDPSHATSGSKSVKITSTKGNDFAPISLIGNAVKGWDKDKFKYLAVDFTTDQDITCPVLVEVLDAKSTNFAGRATIEEGVAPLKKGKVTIYVPLADFKRNDKSGPMDLTQITKARFLISTKDLKEDLVTYMDNVRLTTEEPK